MLSLALPPSFSLPSFVIALVLAVGQHVVHSQQIAEPTSDECCDVLLYHEKQANSHVILWLALIRTALMSDIWPRAELYPHQRHAVAFCRMNNETNISGSHTACTYLQASYHSLLGCTDHLILWSQFPSLQSAHLAIILTFRSTSANLVLFSAVDTILERYLQMELKVVTNEAYRISYILSSNPTNHSSLKVLLIPYFLPILVW